MAKGRQSKKTSSGTRNPDRPNGKAWKKNKFKPKRVRTPERQEKDLMIRMAREKRRQEGMARHAAEKAAAEALRLLREEEERLEREKLEREAADLKRHDPIGVAKRLQNRAKQQPTKPQERKRTKTKRPRELTVGEFLDLANIAMFSFAQQLREAD